MYDVVQLQQLEQSVVSIHKRKSKAQVLTSNFLHTVDLTDIIPDTCS